ncbi:hypothetical protein MTO96_012962 [Rhipicephalus appendiculatus]
MLTTGCKLDGQTLSVIKVGSTAECLISSINSSITQCIQDIQTDYQYRQNERKKIRKAHIIKTSTHCSTHMNKVTGHPNSAALLDNFGVYFITVHTPSVQSRSGTVLHSGVKKVLTESNNIQGYTE